MHPLIWQTHPRSMTMLRALDRRAALRSTAFDPRGVDKQTEEPAWLMHSADFCSQHSHGRWQAKGALSAQRCHLTQHEQALAVCIQRTGVHEHAEGSWLV